MCQLELRQINTNVNEWLIFWYVYSKIFCWFKESLSKSVTNVSVGGTADTLKLFPVNARCLNLTIKESIREIYNPIRYNPTATTSTKDDCCRVTRLYWCERKREKHKKQVRTVYFLSIFSDHVSFQPLLYFINAHLHCHNF